VELQTGAGAAGIVTAFANSADWRLNRACGGCSLRACQLCERESLSGCCRRCSTTAAATQVGHYVDEATVAEEIQVNQAIQFNVVTKVYSFNSPADAIAAEEELAARRSRRGVVRRFLDIFV
jgi:hypothetical protein